MTTTNYTKPRPYNEIIVAAMRETAERLLRTQEQIARLDYNQRTGATASMLRAKPYTITTAPALILNYSKTIRFIDLRKTSTGGKKKIYSAIYNKPLYGHVYGSKYSLTTMLRVGIIDSIKSITAKTQIELKQI